MNPPTQYAARCPICPSVAIGLKDNEGHRVRWCAAGHVTYRDYAEPGFNVTLVATTQEPDQADEDQVEDFIDGNS